MDRAINSTPSLAVNAPTDKTVSDAGEISQSLSEIRQSERSFGNAEMDFRVYQRLAEMMSQGKHGQRWKIRSFSQDPAEIERLDPLGVLRLDRPFLPLRNQEGEGEKAYATFGAFLVKPESFARLSAAIGEILLKGAVKEHLAGGGTVVFSLAPHKSYADIPVCGTAAALLGGEVARNQTEFVHRQVALQQLENFRIIDDGILLTANVLQTFPDSASGKDDAFAEVRDHANMLAVREYTRMVRSGGHVFWLNEGGSETRLDSQTGLQIACRASKGSAGLLHHYNRRGADRVLTIPCAMDCDPFKPGGGFAPHEIPFLFLEPRFLHNDEAVHEMMEETLAVYNTIKRPEIPAARYETVAEYNERLGIESVTI
jgi:hypothetical protein